MIVIKFGGTSVGSAPAIERVTEIVRSRLDKKPVVVVSAFSKVTDMLYKICRREETLPKDIADLRDRHFSVIRDLFGARLKESIALQKDIQAIIEGIEKTVGKAELSERDKASIISTGELMSSKVVCAALCSAGIPTRWVDARTMMVATGDPLKSEPDMDEICERAPLEIEATGLEKGTDADGHMVAAVITQGFICASASGKPALLGRGGSDYSASIIGRAIKAQAVEIWTDVDGVRTADPRRVNDTLCLGRLSYEQASEMAHFGAKVLHPLTLEPAKALGIPVYVLNTHNPQGENTVILPSDQVHEHIKSVSYKENILVLTLCALEPMGTSTFLKKVFDTLSDHKISVDLISTSNSSISITVDGGQKRMDEAIRAMERFANMTIDEGKSQISAIGSSPSLMNGILGTDFEPLQNCRIYMVSPGASFVNISFVVAKSRLDEILRETHKYLFKNESCN